MTGLPNRMRPTKLGDVVGQDAAVKTLKAMASAGFPSRFLMFTGPSGCGKTTLARIVKDRMGCVGDDFTEINAAQERGIDLVRSIESRAGYNPICGGKCRVWLVDECFPAGTMVESCSEEIPIECLRVGSVVRTLDGYSSVKHVFHNKVDLSRIVRIHFTNGTSIVTTKQHRFLTEFGWAEAADLNLGVGIFSDSCYLMGGVFSHKESRHDMQVLQERIQAQESNSSMLLEGMCYKASGAIERTRPGRIQEVSGMCKDLRSSVVESEGFLQQVLCCEEQGEKARDSRSLVQRSSSPEDFEGSQSMGEIGLGYYTKEESFRQDEVQSQSHERFEDSQQDETNQGDEWDFAQMSRGTRGEWEIHPGSASIVFISGGWLGVRSSYSHERMQAQWISDLLQGRLGKQGIKVGNRSRWQESSIESQYIERCKKDRKAQRLRVESVEVYQPGSNDESFMGVVSDQDRIRGFVQFFDIEVDGHPSYFANGLPVHNCHQLTADAQGGFLKLLEEPPGSAYFMFATTDPQKIKPTIRTRATVIELKAVGVKDLQKVVKRALQSMYAPSDENGDEVMPPDVSDDVIERIAEQAQGSPRKALVLLEQVMGIDGEEGQIAALETGMPGKDAIEIARLLIRPGASWPDMVKVLKSIEGLDEQAESIRWLVLSFMATVALGGGKQAGRACDVIEAFRDNFYDSKRAGLIKACHDCIG